MSGPVFAGAAIMPARSIIECRQSSLLGETSPTNGPPGYPGEPYIPLSVSFAMTSGERRRQGHLDYGVSRSYWAEQRPPVPTEEDGETLLKLVRERLPTT